MEKVTGRSVILQVGVLASLILLVGCATSGHVPQDVEFSQHDKVIYVSENYTGYEERHIGDVVRAFEKYGFKITSNQDTATYYLDFTISAGAIANVQIELLRDGKRVINVSSSNYGWGTLIARPAAIASRVNAAIDNLEWHLDRKHAKVF